MFVRLFLCLALTLTVTGCQYYEQYRSIKGDADLKAEIAEMRKALVAFASRKPVMAKATLPAAREEKLADDLKFTASTVMIRRPPQKRKSHG